MTSAIAQKLADKHNAGLKTPAAGHNSGGDKLKSFVDRIVTLEEEKRTFADDIKDVKAEAKKAGIDPKALAVIAKQQMEDADKRAKRLALEEVVDTYRLSLGLVD